MDLAISTSSIVILNIREMIVELQHFVLEDPKLELTVVYLLQPLLKL